MPIQHKLLILAGIIIGSFATGWSVKGAYAAKEQLAITEAKNELINEFRAIEGGIAKTVEDKLSGLKANERIINNEVVKIIDRDVYHNTCLDDAGLQLIERARTGQADTAKPTN